MTKINRNVPNPTDFPAIAERLGDTLRALDGGVSFGTPQDPADDSSTDLAGSTNILHPGTLGNIDGSWVEIEVGTNQLNTAITCYHNLDIPIIAADEPNVRWFVVMWQHGGGQQTRWDDLRVPMTNARVIGGGKPATFGVAPTLGDPFDHLPILWFADTGIEANEEEAFFTAQLPHNYKEGTDIECHVHWTPDADGASGETVRWQLTYSWANIGDPFPGVATAAGSTHAPADAVIAAGDHYYTEIGDLTGTNKTVSSQILGEIKRTSAHVDDDLEEAVGLIELDFHYEIEGMGSDDDDDKTAAYDATDHQTFGVHYDPGDSGVTADSIDLRFTASENVLVNDANKLKCTLFFIPAVR